MDYKISIIVPVYNAGSTLDKCVQSLLDQTYNDIQIILVNDGSKDNSPEICRRYAAKDDRITVIDKPNGGVSTARNTGLDAAAGEFVMFCDSDDWVEQTWCEVMLSHYLPENLVMCGYFCHFWNEEVQTNCCDKTVFSKAEYLKLKQYGAFAPWNKLFNLQIIRENKIRFPSQMSIGEDKLFVWKYLKCICGGIVHIGIPLNHYYVSRGSSLSAVVPKEYSKQCSYIGSEILDDIHSGVECSAEAFDVFCQDMFFEYEKAIKQVLDDVLLDVSEKKTICMEFMSRRDVREIMGTNTTRHSLVGRLIHNRNFWGLYLLNKLKKF